MYKPVQHVDVRLTDRNVATETWPLRGPFADNAVSLKTAAIRAPAQQNKAGVSSFPSGSIGLYHCGFVVWLNRFF